MAPHHPQPPVIDHGVPQLAGCAAAALRDLNHLTRGRDAFADPAELSRLLAELAVMASRLPQLLDQLRRWLHHEHDAAPMRTDANVDPAELVCLAAAHLTRASHCARKPRRHPRGRSPTPRSAGEGIAPQTPKKINTEPRGSTFSRSQRVSFQPLLSAP
jgi:hypothetical protein